MAPDLNPSSELKHVLLWSVPLLIIAPKVIFWYLQAVGNKKNPIRLPPSPLRLPIIGHLHLMVHEPHWSLQRLVRSLGPVVHLQLGGVAAVVFSSPEAAKEVLKTHDVHCCSRPPSPGAKLLTYGQQDIAFSPYNASWRELRKLFVSELVSSKQVHSFSHALEAQIGELIQSLSPMTEPVNLNETLFTLIDGFIGTVAFGSMNGAKLMKYAKFQQVFSEAMVALSAFSAQDFFPASPMSRWFDKLVGLEARYRRIFLELDTYFEMVLSQHMDPGRVKPDKDDLVDVLISLWKGQGKITKDHVKALLGALTKPVLL